MRPEHYFHDTSRRGVGLLYPCWHSPYDRAIGNRNQRIAHHKSVSTVGREQRWVSFVNSTYEVGCKINSLEGFVGTTDLESAACQIQFLYRITRGAILIRRTENK